MNKMRFTLFALTLLLVSVFSASEAQALSARTFVASNGVDGTVNCPRTSPCRNFAFALTQTSAGGEIVALDSAGYGGVSITQAVTIQGAPGVYAAITVGASTSGIIVNPGAGQTVILRDIVINGAGNASTTGITQQSGRLVVKNCTFSQLTTGINVVNSKADLIDSDFWANTTAIRADGTGTDFQTYPIVSGPTMIRVSGGNVINNGTAFHMANPGTRSCTGCTGNKISIFIRQLDNTQSGWATNAMGNTVLVSGSGTGCPTANDCIGVHTGFGSMNIN